MEKNKYGQIIWKGIEPTPEQISEILADHKAWLESSRETFPPHNLSGAELEGAYLNDANLKWADLNGANLSVANLSGTCLSGADLSGTDLYGADLSGADLSLADFSDAHVTSVKYKDLISCLGIRADTCYGSPRFRRHVMDQAYIEELRRSKWGWLYYPWLITSDCGRSLLLWATWALGLALLFAFIYWGFFEGSFKVPDELGFGLWTMIYYSVVTFTTLGFGDVTPITTGASVLVTIEVVLGYLMLGGLISIFANKFARRAG